MVQPEHNARREKNKKIKKKPRLWIKKVMRERERERESQDLPLRQFHIDCNPTENEAIAREGKPELVSMDMAG